MRLLLAGAIGLAATLSAAAQTIPYLLAPQVPFSIGTASAPTGAPVNTVLPVISGTPQVGQTLTVSNGTWTNSPTGFADQWLNGGTPISGATSSTYVPVTGDIGATLTATVTATNAFGSTPATSAGVGPVTSSLPAFQAAVSTLSNGTAGDAFGSNPTFIPPSAAAYETAASVLLADELFGGL